MSTINHKNLNFPLVRCLYSYSWGSKCVSTYNGKNEYFFVPSGLALVSNPAPSGIFDNTFKDEDNLLF